MGEGTGTSLKSFFLLPIPALSSHLLNLTYSSFNMEGKGENRSLGRAGRYG